MIDLINKIEALKTEVNDHMDMDVDYKDLIGKELDEITVQVKKMSDMCCSTELCDCKTPSSYPKKQIGKFYCTVCGKDI